jgi:hypothetical protein
MQKFLPSFVILLAVSFVASQDTGAATAIATLIEDFFVNQSINFDFTNYRCPLVKLAGKISKLVKVPTKILNLDNIEKVLTINQSAILLFNESARFFEFYTKTAIVNEYPTKLHLFVYIQNFKSNDFTQFHFKSWNPKELCNNIYFLVDLQRGNAIDLFTVTTFQQPECRLYQLVEINHFSKTLKKWETRKFIEQKFRNFNGCEMVIAYDESVWDLLRIAETIESNLNFTSKAVSIRNTTTADFGMYQHSMRLVESSHVEGKSFKEQTMTHYIYVRHLVFIISRPEPYSFFEKALLPLDSDVWWWLIGFLAFGVMVIVVVSSMSRKIRDFVFGVKVKAPLLNMM